MVGPIKIFPFLVVLALTPQEREWTKQACTEFSLEALDTGQIPIDAPAFVDCKYAGFAGRIDILSCSAILDVRARDPSDLIRMLSKGDNIRIYGQYIGPAGKRGGTFFVYQLERRRPDTQEFEARRTALPEGDLSAGLDLGDWARTRAKTYPGWSDSLWEKAVEIYEEVVDALEKDASEDDFDRHMKIAQILLMKIDDRKRALEKIQATCLVLRPDDPDSVRFLAEDVRAIPHRGRWKLYEDFKKDKGFVHRKDKDAWIPAPIAVLEVFAAQVDAMNRPLRESDASLAERAENREVVPGMNKYWVFRAISYPEEALRLRHAKGQHLEIWVYPGYYLLFKGDVLFRKDTRLR